MVDWIDGQTDGWRAMYHMAYRISGYPLVLRSYYSNLQGKHVTLMALLKYLLK